MSNLNWRLILRLSVFGLAMAIATVYFISFKIELAFWLIIFILCAYIIAERCNEKYFLNGFFLSILNSVWITGAHLLLFDSYIASHPEEAESMSRMWLPDSPRLMMLITGPMVGIIGGLILGLFAFIASRIVKKDILIGN